jgi:hypothetical protein
MPRKTILRLPLNVVQTSTSDVRTDERRTKDGRIQDQLHSINYIPKPTHALSARSHAVYSSG